MDLKWLQELFPHLPNSQLKETLQNNSLDDCIAILLTNDELVDDMLHDNPYPETLNEPGLNAKIYIPHELDDFISLGNEKEKHAVQTLSSMFPQFEIDSIKHVLRKSQGNETQCIEKLLQYQKHPMDNEELQKLFAILPHVSTATLRQNLDRFKTAELVIEHYFKDNLPYSNLFDPPDQKVQKVEEPFVAVKRQGPVLSHSTRNPADIRKQASDLYLQKRELYKKACEHYKRGNLTGQSSASFYAEQGKQLDNEINRLNDLAADLIFLKNQEGQKKNEFDLHGLTIKESIRLIEPLLRQGMVKIITGAGNHSENGARLYPALTRWFKLRGWQVKAGGNGWFFATKI